MRRSDQEASHRSGCPRTAPPVQLSDNPVEGQVITISTGIQRHSLVKFCLTIKELTRTISRYDMFDKLPTTDYSALPPPHNVILNIEKTYISFSSG